MDYDSELSQARKTAVEAGKLIAERAGQTGPIYTKSFANDLVTETDFAADRLIRQQLSSAFPLDGLLTEESEETIGTSGRRWIVDPLDGTANFVRNLWPSAVSIGFEVQGVPTVGVIYDYRLDNLYSAVAGAGCWLNGQPLRRSSEDVELSAAYVGYNNTSRPDLIDDRLVMHNRIAKGVHAVRDVGSTAVHICLVASGELDAYVCTGVQLWDVAAGFVIAAEAGCEVSGHVDGRPANEHASIVAAPGLTKRLRSLMNAQ